MFTHLLVPLDGSRFAETALPYALEIAAQFDAEIMLLRVVQVPYSGSSTVSPETAESLLTLRDEVLNEAEEYLKNQCTTLRQQGYKVHYRLVEGEQIADEILKVTAEQEIDAIVMSTHGRGGIRRWVYGSVADRILRQADCCPLLLIRAEETADSDWQVGQKTP